MIALSIMCGFLYAEVIGYFIHRVMHNEKIPWLSRAHMDHHLRLYPPGSPMRTEEYKYPKHATKIGIGFEWLIPAALALGIFVLCLSLLGVGALYQAVAVAASIGWAVIIFNYLHDGMHKTGFWLSKNSLFKSWFSKSTKLHDIHHLYITDLGRMDANYGIVFHFMDKIFGTYRDTVGKFNHAGYDFACENYKELLEDTYKVGSDVTRRSIQ